ncbi:MAG TPA: sigma-70 family RNA polymerase sigma factor [Chloroflexota bacterium]
MHTQQVQQRRSDLSTLEELYDAYHRQALGLAYRLLGDRHTAEDVVQEAYLSAWRALDTFDPTRGSIRTWLLTIVRNRALDVCRTRRLQPPQEPVDGHVIVDRQDIAIEVATQLDNTHTRAAVRQLPMAQQHVIELAFFKGLSHTEIALRLGVPVGTIKGRARLGLARLRTVLAARPATLQA